MEVAQNRGLTLCPIESLSDSDDGTPEGLSHYVIIHTPKGTLIYRVSPGLLDPSLRKVNLQNDPLIVVLITVSGGNVSLPKYAPSIILANGDKG